MNIKYQIYLIYQRSISLIQIKQDNPYDMNGMLNKPLIGYNRTDTTITTSYILASIIIGGVALHPCPPGKPYPTACYHRYRE